MYRNVLKKWNIIKCVLSLPLIYIVIKLRYQKALSDEESFIKRKHGSSTETTTILPPYAELTFNGVFPFFEQRIKNKTIDPKIIGGGESGLIVYNGSSRLDWEPKCVPLRIGNKTTPICVHDRDTDNMISSYISDFGMWEAELMEDLVFAFKNEPDLNLVDLGCNIGVFTLVAAFTGRKAVCVEPLLSNLQLLNKSLHVGNLSELVTMVFNALSDAREEVSMEIVSGNIGGSFIKPKERNDKYSVRSILLDDLMDVITFKKAFVKIDIEGHEYRTLSKVTKFFQELDVRYLHMEWVIIKGTSEAKILAENLINHGFLPYSDIRKKFPLHPDSEYDWPDNLYWMKR